MHAVGHGQLYPRSRAEDFGVVFLVLLPFLSKMSLHSIGFLPDSIGILWLQNGLHPVMNSLLSVFALAGLAFATNWTRGAFPLREKLYLTALVLIGAMIGAESVLQAMFIDLNVSLPIHFSGLILTYFLMFGYGWILPRAVRLDELFRVLTWCVRILLALSFLVLLLRPAAAFKGTRFIGFFKHIPYMVTCGQVGLLLEWYQLVAATKTSQRATAIFFLLLSLASIALTGTRSAAVCGLLFIGMAMIKWPVASDLARWSQRSLVYLGVVFALTLGPFAALELKGLLNGETSFFLRPAQNGLQSREEEVDRGMEFVRESPYLGEGLLHRFSSESMEAAGSYNSFRDPHNILVSAGVIGGYPFIAVMTVALLALSGSLIWSFRHTVNDLGDYRLFLLNIYLLSHLPILFVYHLHLSLGGLADRLYWLFMGCVYCVTKERQ